MGKKPTASIEEEVKIDKTVEEAIRRKAFEKIGGMPPNFYRMTVTKVGAKSHRVNVYVTLPSVGEMELVRNPTISHSLFLADA